MKVVIYYFTGTGNNLAIARRLAEKLETADVIPMRRLTEQTIIPKEYDWVVFSVPSYYSHIPPFVRKCMEQLTFAKHQQVVTIVGCAGNRGYATEDMREVLAQRGKKVQLEYMVMLSGNYILSYGAFPKMYNKIVTQLSYKKIDRVAQDIKSRKEPLQLGKGLFYSSKYEESLTNTISQFSVVGSQYEVSDECIQCGKCAKVCPVGNISLERGKVIFGENCQQCMGCIQWCEQQAIDYKGKAKGRQRYHHQDIKEIQ